VVAGSLAVLLITFGILPAWADTVRHSGGTVTGKVTRANAQEVVVDRGQGRQETIEPYRVELILFDDEPATLRTAKMAANAGRFEEALSGLDRVQLPENPDPKVLQEMDYLRAWCRTRLAEASGNLSAMEEAANLLAEFVRKNPDHYRLWQASEWAGNLLVAIGKQDEAQEFFTRLAQAPWPEVQLRAQLASGRAYLAQRKFAEAEKAFEAILQANIGDDRLKQVATLGKARAMAETGRADEAVRLVEGVIKAVSAEQIDLQSQAYNALGLAHQRAGRVKEAVLAYLHVDLLYSNVPAQHVEALENLVSLFGRLGQRERADEAAKILRERYGRTPEGS
jgi:tetratricopeptide (TPR) repeat protein